MVKVDSSETKSPIRSCDSVLKGAKSQPSPLAFVSNSCPLLYAGVNIPFGLFVGNNFERR